MRVGGIRDDRRRIGSAAELSSERVGECTVSGVLTLGYKTHDIPDHDDHLVVLIIRGLAPVLLVLGIGLAPTVVENGDLQTQGQYSRAEKQDAWCYKMQAGQGAKQRMSFCLRPLFYAPGCRRAHQEASLQQLLLIHKISETDNRSCTKQNAQGPEILIWFNTT